MPAVQCVAQSIPSWSPGTVAASLGVTPESLAVAGATSEEARAALSALASAQQWRQTLAESRLLAGLAAARLAEQERALLRQPDDPSLSLARDAAAAALAAHRDAYAQAERALHEIARAPLSAEVNARLDIWRTAARVEVPAEYRVLVLDDAAWVAIQEAVANERAALHAGVSPAPSAVAALAMVRSDPQVRAARERLVERLPAMQETFELWR